MLRRQLDREDGRAACSSAAGAEGIAAAAFGFRAASILVPVTMVAWMLVVMMVMTMVIMIMRMAVTVAMMSHGPHASRRPRPPDRTAPRSA